jgi:hypothetical protein
MKEIKDRYQRGTVNACVMWAQNSTEIPIAIMRLVIEIALSCIFQSTMRPCNAEIHWKLRPKIPKHVGSSNALISQLSRKAVRA